MGKIVHSKKIILCFVATISLSACQYMADTGEQLLIAANIVLDGANKMGSKTSTETGKSKTPTSTSSTAPTGLFLRWKEVH